MPINASGIGWKGGITMNNSFKETVDLCWRPCDRAAVLGRI